MRGLDFLDRLAIAETRDSHRAVATPQHGKAFVNSSIAAAEVVPKGALTLQAKPKKKRGLSWHPQVVTRVEQTHPFSDSRLRESSISEYTPDEEKAAIARMMVKVHLKEMTARVDRNTRSRLNAVAADEGWRRADDLRMGIS